MPYEGQIERNALSYFIYGRNILKCHIHQVEDPVTDPMEGQVITVHLLEEEVHHLENRPHIFQVQEDIVTGTVEGLTIIIQINHQILQSSDFF